MAVVHAGHVVVHVAVIHVRVVHVIVVLLLLLLLGVGKARWYARSLRRGLMYRACRTMASLHETANPA